MKPLHQGELDGLCGLYAIINGIRVCSTFPQRLTVSQSKVIFGEMIKRHEARFPAYARIGMEMEQVEDALRFALRLCVEKHGLKIGCKYEEFRGLKPMQEALESHFWTHHRAAIIAVDGHSTVVTDIEGQIWKLCDSHKYQHLYCTGKDDPVSRGGTLLRARPESYAFLLGHLVKPGYGIGPKDNEF